MKKKEMCYSELPEADVLHIGHCTYRDTGETLLPALAAKQLKGNRHTEHYTTQINTRGRNY